MRKFALHLPTAALPPRWCLLTQLNSKPKAVHMLRLGRTALELELLGQAHDVAQHVQALRMVGPACQSVGADDEMTMMQLDLLCDAPCEPKSGGAAPADIVRGGWGEEGGNGREI